MTIRNLAVTDCTDSWVDGVKFISCAVVPNVLPFFDREPRNVRNEIRSREFHFIFIFIHHKVANKKENNDK